jgi:hypothetical protein
MTEFTPEGQMVKWAAEQLAADPSSDVSAEGYQRWLWEESNGSEGELTPAMVPVVLRKAYDELELLPETTERDELMERIAYRLTQLS